MRNLYLQGEIDEEESFNLIREIHQINEEDDGLEFREEVNLWLTTNGGSIAIALAVCDVIRLSRTPIHVIASGRCYSAGVPILASGDIRSATKHTTFMMHQGTTEMMGNIEMLKVEIGFITSIDKMCDDIVLEQTKIKQSELDLINKSAKDFHFGCDKAKKWGLIHNIL